MANEEKKKKQNLRHSIELEKKIQGKKGKEKIADKDKGKTKSSSTTTTP